MLKLETGFLGCCHNMLAIRECGMLGSTACRDTIEGTVSRSHDTAYTVKILHVFSCQNIFYIQFRTAEVNDDRIIFKGRIYEIITDTSDIPDPVKFLPVFQNSHLSAHAAFFHDLIEDCHIAESVLRLRLFVDRVHDSKRTGLCNIFVLPFIGKRAAYHTRCRRYILR